MNERERKTRKSEALQERGIERILVMERMRGKTGKEEKRREANM